ncbi:hypothetical protein TNCT_338811 [Trichonephila clavata]|uniref:Uncharacterized protein n=1 Tax=Trichonephila clavata TaxID=2740835 RepID=A0A8X6I8Y3_TRICU|nr:hypothetical protein TNCT_338811 [Trichonephila clavata]
MCGPGFLFKQGKGKDSRRERGWSIVIRGTKRHFSRKQSFSWKPETDLQGGKRSLLEERGAGDWDEYQSCEVKGVLCLEETCRRLKRKI